MYSKEDFKVESFGELLSFVLILPFLGLVGPFLGLVYTIGFIEDKLGWLDT